MNTHNVNVKTATPESPKTWSERLNTNGLSASLAVDITFLISLCDGSTEMLVEERWELIHGCVKAITEGVCNAVTDWSEPRPRIPATVVAAWLLVHEIVISYCADWGPRLWADAVRELKNMLIVGYAHP
ncbi:hypothetical protein [Pantoea sp. ME81]|uniref:hypothetical protein n=1 Tax=Pantoea sp. ME81 TaxID=2743935 RepID=UPI0015F72280|nr:hypothetical protein [Pantoea sp. ME81]